MNEFDFPFEPYPQQLKLMQALYQNIIDNINTAYESPTGTGKSLMILSVIKKYIQNRYTNHKQAQSDKLNSNSNVPAWIQQQYQQMTQNQLRQEISNIKSLQQYITQITVLPLDTINIFNDYIAQLINLNETSEINAVQFNTLLQDLFYWKVKSNSIIFASRTHSQLEQFNQVIKQYSDLQTVILASRSTYCINERVKDVEDVDVFCQNNRASCIYFKNQKMLNALISLFKKYKIVRLNTKELKEFIQSQMACPYYISKLLQQFVDVSLLTHTQLLNMEGDDLQYEANQLVIIDECHNLVEQICQNSQQKLKVVDMIIMLLLINKYIIAHQNYLNLNDLKLLIKLQDFICQIIKMLQRQISEKSKCYLSNDLVNLLKQFKLNIIYSDVVNFIKENNYVHRIRQKVNQGIFYQLLNFLNLFSQPNIYDYMLIFDNLYENQIETNLQKYTQSVLKVFGEKCATLEDLNNHLFNKQSSTIPFNLQRLQSNTSLMNTTIELTQLQPSFNFNESAEKFNIHMLGGTISPFNNFKSYFSFPLYFQQFQHIISPEQLKIRIVTQVGQDDQFKFTFQQFENIELYQQLLKQFIEIRFLKLQPQQNMIVFVPSYQILRRFKNILESQLKNLIAQMPLLNIEDKLTTTFEEPGVPLEMIQMNCKTHQNHILFGIANGSLAEGIDFKDDLCRQLIVLGIPMPNMKSAYVQEKLKIDPDYALAKAFKAINQCIGRAIRWKGDWSNVLLVDSRYVRYFDTWLSKWIQESKYQVIKW